MSTKKEGKPKAILLQDISDEVWTTIQGVKLTIKRANKYRGKVSHQEAIFKLILNNCQ